MFVHDQYSNQLVAHFLVDVEDSSDVVERFQNSAEKMALKMFEANLEGKAIEFSKDNLQEKMLSSVHYVGRCVSTSTTFRYFDWDQENPVHMVARFVLNAVEM
jgi:superfamily II helicase